MKKNITLLKKAHLLIAISSLLLTQGSYAQIKANLGGHSFLTRNNWPEEQYITVTPKEKTVGWELGTFKLYVDALYDDVGWSINESHNFEFIYEISPMDGIGDGTVTLYYSENEGSEERHDKLTFLSDNTPHTTHFDVNITQKSMSSSKKNK